MGLKSEGQSNICYKETYKSFPNIGANPLIFVATAARTCWLVSITSSLMHGKIFSIMIG